MIDDIFMPVEYTVTPKRAAHLPEGADPEPALQGSNEFGSATSQTGLNKLIPSDVISSNLRFSCHSQE